MKMMNELGGIGIGYASWSGDVPYRKDIAGIRTTPLERAADRLHWTLTTEPNTEHEAAAQKRLLTAILELVEDHIVYADGRLHRLKVDNGETRYEIEQVFSRALAHHFPSIQEGAVWLAGHGLDAELAHKLADIHAQFDIAMDEHFQEGEEVADGVQD